MELPPSLRPTLTHDGFRVEVVGVSGRGQMRLQFLVPVALGVGAGWLLADGDHTELSWTFRLAAAAVTATVVGALLSYRRWRERRQTVQLEVTATHLVIERREGEPERWPLSELGARPAQQVDRAVRLRVPGDFIELAAGDHSHEEVEALVAAINDRCAAMAERMDVGALAADREAVAALAKVPETGAP